VKPMARTLLSQKDSKLTLFVLSTDGVRKGVGRPGAAAQRMKAR